MSFLSVVCCCCSSNNAISPSQPTKKIAEKQREHLKSIEIHSEYDFTMTKTSSSSSCRISEISLFPVSSYPLLLSSLPLFCLFSLIHCLSYFFLLCSLVLVNTATKSPKLLFAVLFMQIWLHHHSIVLGHFFSVFAFTLSHSVTTARRRPTSTSFPCLAVYMEKWNVNTARKKSWVARVLVLCEMFYEIIIKSVFLTQKGFWLFVFLRESSA